MATVAQAEPLALVPALPYPVIISQTRTASRQALVSYRGNRYSVPPELAAAQVVVSHPVGAQCCDIATTSGIVVARHRLAADALGVMVRDSGHVIALDTAAMTTATTGRPHRRKERIPPGRRPDPPPHNCWPGMTPTHQSANPPLHQMNPQSSTCPSMSGQPRKGP
ncbi:putative transposase IstA protein [Mycobacterium kansasii 824]|nr:putative transposase IstA protein [Mycobacterium kansasii 824]